MADARRVGHVGEFYNINLNFAPEGRVANLEEYTNHLPIRLRLPIQWLNECLGRDEWRDLRQCGQGLSSSYDSMVRLYQVNFSVGSSRLFFCSFFNTLHLAARGCDE